MNLFDFNLTLPITDPTWVFFLVLIIILFAPMILGRLHIPHIIGMILAGVLIGEHGFHVLDRDSSFELFGKVGLYYIMFLAGLEMDMEDFKKNRTKSIVFGWLTFLSPMGLGIWSSMSVLGYGFLTAVLLASMYASHTLIAYPIISRYGLSRLRSVNITIGGTAVTVTLALIILAVIGGMFKGTVDGWFWGFLVAKVAFSKFRFPCSSFFSELLLSLITFNAIKPFFCLASFITKARFIKSSIVSGLATGINICSVLFFAPCSSDCNSSFIAKRRAERSVTKELITQVKRIITTVPFNTSSFSKRSPFSIIIS